MKPVLIVMALVLVFTLAACADDGDPGKAVADYFQAKVEGDSDKFRSV